MESFNKKEEKNTSVIESLARSNNNFEMMYKKFNGMPNDFNKKHLTKFTNYMSKNLKDDLEKKWKGQTGYDENLFSTSPLLLKNAYQMAQYYNNSGKVDEKDEENDEALKYSMKLSLTINGNNSLRKINKIINQRKKFESSLVDQRRGYYEFLPLLQENEKQKKENIKLYIQNKRLMKLIDAGRRRKRCRNKIGANESLVKNDGEERGDLTHSSKIHKQNSTENSPQFPVTPNQTFKDLQINTVFSKFNNTNFIKTNTTDFSNNNKFNTKINTPNYFNTLESDKVDQNDNSIGNDATFFMNNSAENSNFNVSKIEGSGGKTEDPRQNFKGKKSKISVRKATKSVDEKRSGGNDEKSEEENSYGFKNRLKNRRSYIQISEKISKTEQPAEIKNVLSSKSPNQIKNIYELIVQSKKKIRRFEIDQKDSLRNLYPWIKEYCPEDRFDVKRVTKEVKILDKKLINAVHNFDECKEM